MAHRGNEVLVTIRVLWRYVTRASEAMYALAPITRADLNVDESLRSKVSSYTMLASEFCNADMSVKTDACKVP